MEALTRVNAISSDLESKSHPPLSHFRDSNCPAFAEILAEKTKRQN
jgi:hypothetical protein